MLAGDICHPTFPAPQSKQDQRFDLSRFTLFPRLDSKLNKKTDTANIFQNLKVKTLDGKDIKLSTLWKEKTVLLKVLPRLGCVLCRHEALMSKRLSPILEQHNISLVAVAFEDIDLKDFLNGYWEWDIFLDTDRQVYKAANLTSLNAKQVAKQIKSSFVQMLDLFLMKDKGIPDSMRGDISQLGGTFIINPNNEILYEFKPTRLATFPSIQEICYLVGGELDDVEDEIPMKHIIQTQIKPKSKSTRSVSSIKSNGSEL